MLELSGDGVIEGKIIKKMTTQGNKNHLELAGGSSYRGLGYRGLDYRESTEVEI